MYIGRAQPAKINKTTLWRGVKKRREQAPPQYKAPPRGFVLLTAAQVVYFTMREPVKSRRSIFRPARGLAQQLQG